jgi:hypothetical protein
VQWREHRAEMIHQMEKFLSYGEKCRRVELLRHFEPGEALFCCRLLFLLGTSLYQGNKHDAGAMTVAFNTSEIFVGPKIKLFLLSSLIHLRLYTPFLPLHFAPFLICIYIYIYI